MSNLALTLRPDSLDSFLGGDHIKKALKSFADKDNWPNVILFYGPPGTGKTTLALIVAKLAGAQDDGLREVNASADNGVDTARQLEELSRTRPFSGQRRVIILNEAHALTVSAQNALKDPMEKSDCIWILTTDRVEKLEPAIRSRAAAATFELKPLTEIQIITLCEQALIFTNPAGVWQPKTDQAAEYLYKNNVRQPREVLGAMDLFFVGTPIEQAIHGAEHEPLYRDVAGAVLRGDWTKTSSLLSQIKAADCRGLAGITSSFLRSEILKTPLGAKADSLSACLVGMDNLGFADGTAYGAVTGLLYKVCRAIQKGNQ